MQNKYEIHGDSVVIFIERQDGTVLKALIDLEDLPKIAAFKGTWRVSKASTNRFYVLGCIKKGKSMHLHRLIMNPPPGYCIDHINNQPLDNRKSNLRVVTHAENHQNRAGAQRNSRSGVRGVHWCNTHKKWVAQFKLNKKLHKLGYFKTLMEARLAVEAARAKHMPYSKDAMC